MSAGSALGEVAKVARGRGHRADPVLPGTGGPAGNAQLTAWLGLTLLVLFLAELVTLLDVRGLITWHLAIGLLLIPPALVKTATTSWRFARYYSGAAVYQQAGPPPLLLRLLGPLVVLGTMALLGTGVAVMLVGPDAAGRPILAALGQQVSPLTLHQASVLVWAVPTGLHVIARILPALGLATTRSAHEGARLPGTGRRVGVLLTSALVAATGTITVLTLTSSWDSIG